MPRSRPSRRRKLGMKARGYRAVIAPSPSSRGVARSFDAVEAYEAARKKGRRDPACGGCALDAAIEVVHEFLDLETSHQLFQDYFEASLRYANLLSRLGTDERNLLEFILPRLPFDLVTKGRTPAEDFLLRWGTSLPPEGVEAIKALLSAEDEFVEVTEDEGRAALRRLRATARRPWGHALPLPEGTVLLGRLVDMQGRFHLFTPEVLPGVKRATWRRAAPWTAVFRQPVQEQLRIDFRSPAKDLHLVSLVQGSFMEDMEKSAKKSRRGARKGTSGKARHG